MTTDTQKTFRVGKQEIKAVIGWLLVAFWCFAIANLCSGCAHQTRYNTLSAFDRVINFVCGTWQRNREEVLNALDGSFSFNNGSDSGQTLEQRGSSDAAHFVVDVVVTDSNPETEKYAGQLQKRGVQKQSRGKQVLTRTTTSGRGTLTEFPGASLGIITIKRGQNLAPIIHDTYAKEYAYSVCGPMFSIVSGSGYRQSSEYRLIREARDFFSGTSETANHQSRAIAYSPIVGLKAVNATEHLPLETFRAGLYPWLITGGRNAGVVASVDNEVVRRAMLGITRNGLAAVYTWTGSMLDGVNWAIESGVIEAGYLDGGGSFSEYVESERIHGARPEFQRPIASLIVSRNFYIEPVHFVGAVAAIGAVFLLTR